MPEIDHDAQPPKLREDPGASLRAEIQSLQHELAATRHALARSQTESAALVQRLEDAVRAREDFLTIASHELRNPMNAVALQVEILSSRIRRFPDYTAGTMLPSIERLRRQVGRFVLRATTLLDVTRFLAGKVVLEREPLDLAALVDEVLDGFDSELAQSGTTLVKKLPVPVHGNWDRLRLEQIVSNLVSNGIKYGSGKTLTVHLEPVGEQVCLEVADEGVGISPADQSRIFQRFERLVGRREHGGFGVGLWIVRQLVEAMSGSISVTSEVGKGSSFVVILPRSLNEGEAHR